jgi:polyisoprenoid-binding protein YceI
MKTLRFFISSILLLLASFSLNAEVVKLTLDPNHTYVLWQIGHLGFSTQAGKWYANGTVTIDQEKPENSKVDATIKVADIVTGLPELDKHLKGPLFFDVAKFPTATFVSDKVEVLSKTTAKVSGNLTIHGISKPITLDVTLNKVGKNPINDKETAGFTATTTIKRSDFGLKALLPELGDEVKIVIGAEAYVAS